MPGRAGSESLFQFGVFELDLQAGELRKRGIRIKIQEQPLQILGLRSSALVKWLRASRYRGSSGAAIRLSISTTRSTALSAECEMRWVIILKIRDLWRPSHDMATVSLRQLIGTSPQILRFRKTTSQQPSRPCSYQRPNEVTCPHGSWWAWAFC